MAVVSDSKLGFAVTLSQCYEIGVKQNCFSYYNVWVKKHYHITQKRFSKL